MCMCIVELFSKCIGFMELAYRIWNWYTARWEEGFSSGWLSFFRMAYDAVIEGRILLSSYIPTRFGSSSNHKSVTHLLHV